MATIQKSSKLDFYKFVKVKQPGGSKSSDLNVAKAINKNTIAINNIGATLNSFGKAIADIKKSTIAAYELEEKNKKKFEAEYNKGEKQRGSGGSGLSLAIKKPGFLESLGKLLASLFKIFIVSNVLKWIADPANTKKVRNVIEGISKLVKFIANVAKFGVVNTIDGLYKLLSDESSPLDRIKGLLQGLTGLGTLMLGLRWLSNPTRIITDFGNTLIFLYNNLVRGRRGLLGRAGALGLVAAGAFGGYKAYNYLKEGQTTATQVDEGQEPQNKPEGFSKGGKVKVPQRAQGGWINGPQSGYPVSLDGGRSTSFIGHGKEYVARKANGGAFVIPFNTPGTKTQPHLTDKRLGEAKSQGFDIGGLIGSQFKAGKGFESPMGKSVIPDYAPESKSYAKGGKIPEFANGGNLNKQIYLHWVASTHTWRQGPYHTTVQGDGSLYKNKPYDQHTNHTYGRNTGNVGLSIAAMKEWNWERYGPTKPQLEALTAEAASIAKKWGWKPSDVTIKRVMTHAEAASNKDGRRMHDNYGPTFWGGNGERSDLHKLKRNAKDGSGGDILRQMIKKYMGMKNPPLLREAGPGAGPGGGGGDGNVGGSIEDGKEYNLLQRLVLAEAGGEGKLGMALVARSVLNRTGLIQKGIVGKGMFMANDSTVTGVIMGRNQYQPIRDGGIDKPRTAAQMAEADAAIKLARNPAGLRGTLEAEGFKAEQINYLMGSTGFRTGSAFNDPSQNVNVVKYKNHYFNTAGNKKVETHLAEIENGGTGGGYGAGDYGGTDSGSGGSAPGLGGLAGLLDLRDSASGLGFAPSSSKSIEERLNLRESDSNFVPSSISGTQTTANRLQSQTDGRNATRREFGERTQQMMSAALEQVAKTNGLNTQAIIAAQRSIQQVSAQGQSKQPTLIGGGTAPKPSTASKLMSTLNPLTGLL